MRFMDVFLAATMPVLKVIIVTLVGSLLALDRINIFPEDARKHFNNVVFYVFCPALIFANLAQTLTLQSLLTLWFMPLNILITFVFGSFLGWILIKLTKAPPHLRGLILGCCSAGNLGNMFLIIVPAVCKEKGSPFGDRDVCYKYGMAYASLSTAIGSIYIWTYVYNIVRISSTKTKNVAHAGEETHDEIQLSSRGHLKPEEYVGESTLPYTVSNQNPESAKLYQKLKKLAGKIELEKLLAPSTIGAILGFIVGVVPPFRKSMIGETAPLHVIQDSILLLGDGTIPTMSLVMGGNLTKGLKKSEVHTGMIVGIVVVRYILSPLFGVFIVRGATHIGIVHSDPLYEFVLLLQYAVPPAMAIGTITQLFGAGENECSVIMLWAYALASISLTLWCFLFMWLVS
ncbi:hypothetical protein ACHQM5_020772 [Ranunculus cassubicifolius]